MCGIIGIINSDGRLGEQALAVLNDTMRSRGPDGAGLFWSERTGMAMRRLAIIDLEGGQQPIFSEDQGIAVVMNGEIYNFQALRQELAAAGHRLATRSDTEVLVHGYEQFGIDRLLERLDGMYAFALWDRPRGRLFLARDRLGEKPLYFARQDGTVVFGSQLLTVAAGLRWTPPVCAEALQWYWALHFVPGDLTIFKGVRRLRPGEACEIDVASGQQVRRWRYWRLREGRQRRLCPAELAELIVQAVRSRLIADVPVGVFLSGGLDSSLLASLAARQVPGIHTFAMGFDCPRHDESGSAWEVADYIGATHHHFVFRVEEFRALIPEVIACMDEPVGDQAMLPLYALAQAASKHVKVALSGEGADELFGGYAYYAPFAQALASEPASSRTRMSGPQPHRGPDIPVRDGRWQGLFTDEERTISGFPAVLPRMVREQLSRGTASPFGWQQPLLAGLAAVKDPLRRAQLCDINTWLSEDLLMKADKMTMAHSLEGRAPYLAPALVETAVQLPADQKIAGGSVKVLLREVARRHLPRAIVARPKQGWVLPMERWLRDELHEEFVESIRACSEPLIDASYMEKVVRADRSATGPPVGGRALYAVLVMVRWLDHARKRLHEIRAAIRQAP